MARQHWELDSATGKCTTTGRALAEGEEFYTVLFEEGDTFRRADFSTEGWQGPPEGCYCHFKTRVPVKEKKKKLLVDDELLVGFFQRLADDPEPVRVHFRFVLALILMRKRTLRYEGSVVEDGAEVWTMALPREGSTHRVINPRLSDDQIEAVSAQLTAILHSDMGIWAEPTPDERAAETDNGADTGGAG